MWVGRVNEHGSTVVSGSGITASGAAGAAWLSACQTLKRELGDAAYGSWLGQASLREGRDGALVLVTPTGMARDWIRRNAWRRIAELWAENDPQGRRLDLKSRQEFDA